MRESWPAATAASPSERRRLAVLVMVGLPLLLALSLLTGRPSAVPQTEPGPPPHGPGPAVSTGEAVPILRAAR